MQNQKFKDLVKQELKNKTRSIKDLARFVQRNNGYPSYSVFLGAGASVTSGIPTGGSLVKQWREEIYKEVFDSNIESLKDNELEIINYLSKNEGIWYNPQNEYSSLFERKFDLPSQRRRFVESIVDNKKPSIGYNYLINLVNEKAFNTIFTTNFDDLLNESNQNNNLSSIEFKQILEIQNLILTGSFNKTVAKIDKLLQDSGCDLSSELTKFQENLFFMKIDCLEKEKKIEQANEAINSLIASDKFNLTYHHKKILLINDSKKNIEYLLSILDLFPYSASIRNDICRSYLSYYLKNKVEPDLINVDKCLNYIEESLNIDNSLDNLAYEIKVELLFIKKDLISKKTSSTLNRNKIIDETNDQIKELIVKVLTVSPKHQNSIDCLINYLIKSDSSVDFLKFYNQIFLNIDKSSKKQKRYIIKSFAMLFNKRKMLERYQKDSDIKKEAVNFFSKPEFDSNIFYLLYKTMFMISLNVRDISFYNLIEKCINHKNVYEIALELVSLLESLDLKDEVRSLDLIMKNHQDKLTPYEASLFSKNVSLLLYGAKSDEFMDYLENTRKLCPSFSRYLIKYTYDLLLAEKFDQVLECLKNSSEIIQDLDEDDRAVLKINEATAYKKINNGQLSNSIYEELKKIVSKSLSQEITISCKSLMDDQQTLSNIKTLINIDHHFYYYFQQWPVISDNLKQQLRNNYEKHMIVTLDRAS
ncbi:hypothetical protein ACLDX4_06705 [Acinetobacter baumannii]